MRLLGHRRDIEALMCRASAVVLSSLHEGMSNAVMEAMAAGRPIVATAVGGPASCWTSAACSFPRGPAGTGRRPGARPARPAPGRPPRRRRTCLGSEEPRHGFHDPAPPGSVPAPSGEAMCAIAGAVSTGCVDPDTVRDMCETMVHRGPDGSGLHTEPSTVLGMRRLAVVDVAGGDQPVYSEDGTVVAVFNGEIYNFAELRAGLLARGHRLTSGGDSECLVHLYEEYGDSSCTTCRGMFAFALWDGRRRRLLLARDRVGKKPLYWGIRSGSLRFASELKALVRDPEWRTEVDPIALHHYLTFQYVPAPWSIIEGIHKLPPGSTLVWEGGDVRVNRYWRLDATPGPPVPWRRRPNGYASCCWRRHGCG
ncbi:glycosyltransferase [Streptosporangium lutulentum]